MLEEHRAIFVNALRSGDEIRRRIFDNIEQHHAHDFGNGRAGIELYEEFLYALRDSGMPEVMKEFERRLCNHSGAPSTAPRLGQGVYPLCGCILRLFHHPVQRFQFQMTATDPTVTAIIKRADSPVGCARSEFYPTLTSGTNSPYGIRS